MIVVNLSALEAYQTSWLDPYLKSFMEALQRNQQFCEDVHHSKVQRGQVPFLCILHFCHGYDIITTQMLELQVDQTRRH